MNDSNKTLMGFGLGLLAGGIVGYYLASDDGKKMRKQVKRQIAQIDQGVRSTLKEQADSLSAKLNEVAENTKMYANDLSETAKNKIALATHVAEETVNEAENSFSQGMNTAKAKMQVERAKIANIIENEHA